jgi:hypothetical protein
MEFVYDMREFPLDDIILDYAIYGRGEVNASRVAALTEIYTERPETFEPIRLWVDDGVIKLCDGFARYLAAQAAGLPEVTGFIDETIQTAREAKRASVQHNTRERDGIHKARLDAYIIECWRDGMSRTAIQLDVNRSQGYISTILKPFADVKDWMRDLDILRLHLAGHTDAQITEALGGDLSERRVAQLRGNIFTCETISTILNETRPDYVAIRDDRLGSHLLHPWEPPPVIFSVDVLSGGAMVEQELDGVDPQLDVSTYWALSSTVAHQYGTEADPGRIPGQIVEGLLHLYTKPFDHVYDPFAGGGTTLDVCKAYFRRYWGSDIAPLATRREIRQHDILRGAPPFFPQGYRMDFIMLDPPAWVPMTGESAADTTTLAHLPLPHFYEALDTVLTTCKGLLTPDGVMALIIGPTHHGRHYDHAMDMAMRLDRLGLTLMHRLVVPSSTQQTQDEHLTQMREANRTAECNAHKRLCNRYREVLVIQAGH